MSRSIPSTREWPKPTHAAPDPEAQNAATEAFRAAITTALEGAQL